MLNALVVDDEPEGRWRVADLLALHGWDVFQAAGPGGALRQAVLLEPDLIVIDRIRSSTSAALRASSTLSRAA